MKKKTKIKTLYWESNPHPSGTDSGVTYVMLILEGRRRKTVKTLVSYKANVNEDDQKCWFSRRINAKIDKFHE